MTNDLLKGAWLGARDQLYTLRPNDIFGKA